MKYELNETDRKLIERVDRITNYHTKIDDDNYIEVSLILACLDDLETEYHKIYSEYEGFKESSKPCDINDNWNYYSKMVYNLQEELSKQYEFIKKKGLEEEYERSNSN